MRPQSLQSPDQLRVYLSSSQPSLLLVLNHSSFLRRCRQMFLSPLLLAAPIISFEASNCATFSWSTEAVLQGEKAPT